MPGIYMRRAFLVLSANWAPERLLKWCGGRAAQCGAVVVEADSVSCAADASQNGWSQDPNDITLPQRTLSPLHHHHIFKPSPNTFSIIMSDEYSGSNPGFGGSLVDSCAST